MSSLKIAPIRKGWLAEKKLLWAVKGNRPEALEKFCRQQVAPLARLAAALEPDGSLALALLQGTLVSAFQTQAARREEIRLDEWLASVLLRQWFRRARPAPDKTPTRQRRGRGKHPQGRAQPAAAPVFHGWRQAAQDTARLEEARKGLKQAAGCLPVALRASWVLADVMGRDVAQLGRILALEEPVAADRLHRARLALLQSLCPSQGKQPATPDNTDHPLALDCTEMRAFLAVPEESPGKEAGQAREHLARCPACVDLSVSYRLLGKVAGKLPSADPPADLAACLASALKEADGPQPGAAEAGGEQDPEAPAEESCPVD